MPYLNDVLQQAVKVSYPDYTGPIDINKNSDITLGEFASPVAFQIAKQMNGNPREIADRLVQTFASQLSDGLTVTVSAGSPFLNFHVGTTVWNKLIEPESTVKPVADGQQILLEFISANPTGPLTLANARGGYSGDALGRVLEFAGAAKVEREYYYNDSGNQIMELGKSVLATRNNELIEGGYKGEYIKELAQNITIDEPYAAGQEASEYIFSQWIKPMIHRMGIRFDYFKSEQSLLDNGTLETVMTILQQADLIYEHEGALWLKTTKFGDDKDRVMQRSDEGGNYTYLAKDIAYHFDKMKRGYHEMVTMVGADHFTEAKTLDLIVRHILAPAIDWQGTFRQPIIQFVRLVANGTEVKMSKRAGTFVTIDDLLDQIPSDVARFFFLMRDLNSAMDFDLSLAKESSDKNPVYYVQYAYVRAKHILERSAAVPAVLAAGELAQEERRLLVHLTHEFTALIDEIVATYEVHKLAHYAIELAKLFHSFYAKYPVLQAEGDARTNRLIMTQLTYKRLETVLHLMGISQPERMVASEKEV